MKTFLIAMCILLALIVAIGINTYYFSHFTDDLLQATVSLPSVEDEACLTALERLQARWERGYRLIGLSVNYNLVEQTGNLIAVLRVNCLEGASEDYEANRVLLLRAIRQLRNLERFSIWNII